MEPGAWPRGVTVGRYVSVGSGVLVFVRNHPLDRLSLHPFFYNSVLGLVPEDNIPSGWLEVGHDAWLGSNAIVTYKCHRIGIGAVVGAGAVVTKDVPDFAIVAGNPARILRYRFPEVLRQSILETRWWERSIEECARSLDEMTKSFESISSVSLPISEASRSDSPIAHLEM
jgi:acetyltransferase-like isoleucine patch superfamily enzyme